MLHLKNWRSNPPFLFPSVAERDLPMTLNLAKSLTILVFSIISLKSLKESMKSSEVKTITRASCFIELL